MKPDLKCPCGCGKPVRTKIITLKYAEDKCRYKVAKRNALQRKIEREKL